MVLNPADRFSITRPLLPLPVAPQLDSAQSVLHRALETDQDLNTPALAHELQQFDVLIYGNIRLGEPPDMPVPERAKQLLPVLPIDERVIVRELQEGVLPDGLYLIDLGQYSFDRFLLITGGQNDRTRAELTLMRPGSSAR
jgi:hypothetical protein